MKCMHKKSNLDDYVCIRNNTFTIIKFVNVLFLMHIVGVVVVILVS